MNLRDPKKAGNFLTSWVTISFSRRLCSMELKTSTNNVSKIFAHFHNGWPMQLDLHWMLRNTKSPTQPTGSEVRVA
jgi:hypothetical protein